MESSSPNLKLKKRRKRRSEPLLAPAAVPVTLTAHQNHPLILKSLRKNLRRKRRKLKSLKRNRRRRRRKNPRLKVLKKKNKKIW